MKTIERVKHLEAKVNKMEHSIQQMNDNMAAMLHSQREMKAEFKDEIRDLKEFVSNNHNATMNVLNELV